MSIWRVQRAPALGANHARAPLWVFLLQFGGLQREVGVLLPIKIIIFLSLYSNQLNQMTSFWFKWKWTLSHNWFGNFTDFLSKGQVWFIQDWKLEKSSPIIKMSKGSIHRHVGNIQTTDTSLSSSHSIQNPKIEDFCRSRYVLLVETSKLWVVIFSHVIDVPLSNLRSPLSTTTSTWCSTPPRWPRPQTCSTRWSGRLERMVNAWLEWNPDLVPYGLTLEMNERSNN